MAYGSHSCTDRTNGSCRQWTCFRLGIGQAALPYSSNVVAGTSSQIVELAQLQWTKAWNFAFVRHERRNGPGRIDRHYNRSFVLHSYQFGSRCFHLAYHCLEDSGRSLGHYSGFAFCWNYEAASASTVCRKASESVCRCHCYHCRGGQRDSNYCSIFPRERSLPGVQSIFERTI